jgi:hypothetical protein
VILFQKEELCWNEVFSQENAWRKYMTCFFSPQYLPEQTWEILEMETLTRERLIRGHCPEVLSRRGMMNS